MVFIWIPAIAALIGFLPGVTPRFSRWTAFTVTLGLFIWSLILAGRFEQLNSNWQFQEYAPWIESLGITYHLGVDGLSLPLLILNGLLTAIAVYFINTVLPGMI